MMEERPLVVTTRSRVRGLRYFPAMLLATLRVRRQLARTPGIVRWVSLVTGPREFWTITVWRSRREMQEFMRSGAHGEIMWLLSRWLSSFWLMRWGGGEREIGSWDGLSLARDRAATSQRPPPFVGDDVRRPRANLSGAGGAVVRIRGTASSLSRAVASCAGCGATSGATRSSSATCWGSRDGMMSTSSPSGASAPARRGCWMRA
jgi:hypothetical protein